MHDKDCTDFEVAIERELHGALDPAGAVRLAEHLHSCASCLAYQRTAMEMETNMEKVGDLFSAGVEWGRLKTKVEDQVADLRTRRWAGVIIGALALGVAVAVEQQLPSWQALMIVGAAFAAVVARIQWRITSLEKHAHEAESSSADLFQLVLTENQRNTRRLAILLPVLGLVIARFVYYIIVRNEPRQWLMVVILGAAFVSGVQRLLSLRRERASLRRS